MGAEAEKIYSQLTIAAAPDDTLYDRTLQAFETYFNPTDSKLHHCVIFNGRSQLEKETNEEFIRNLYELVKKCGYDDAQQESMLKMRLLTGMRDKTLSRELQLDADVTLDQIKKK
jgi:hypothetical protein